MAVRNDNRRRRKGGRPRPPRRPRLRGLWFYARHLIAWGLMAVLAYWLWLDHEVADAFEHKRWELPARVFARALELYPGAAVSRDRLVRELERLGYQPVAAPTAGGQFKAAGATVEFHSRGFAYWDLPESPRRVKVKFAGAAVEWIVDVGATAPIDLMRLEPPEIGRINPKRFEDRRLLSYAEVPPQFIAALVAVEDRRFFDHHGIDFIGLARALQANLRAGRLVQGGSTLTQQLVKNLYLTRERTLVRKLNEMMMAISLELRYSKEEILETYINEVFLGQDGNRAIHGFELAARFYFARPLAELNRVEMATLVGMVKGPSVYDPRRHPERALQRRNVVLGVLAEARVIEPAQLAELQARPLQLQRRADYAGHDYPAFMGLVRRQLRRDYTAEDLNVAGLNIFTTLDVELQHAAERAVVSTVAKLERDTQKGNLQAALIVLEPTSGEVLAMVGDRNPEYAGFNRAVDARRPIGSVVKPFIYALALDQPERYSLLTRLSDTAVTWTAPDGKRWQPRNFDNREHGEVYLLHALTRSLNLATVNLGLQLGLPQVASYLDHVGVPGPIPPYPSMLLGAIDMSPLSLAELYTIFANDGFRVPARVISAVTDQDQRKLQRYGLEVKPVMRPATAALVRYALTRVVAEGTGRALQVALPGIAPLAGKTGTSNDNRDSWFAGFGDNLLGVAWIGRDDNAPTGLTGSAGALRLWAAVMKEAGITAVDLALPAAVEWQRVDMNFAIVLPSFCPNGTLLPLHRDSKVERAETCTAQAPPPARRGIFDRIEELFR